jgi:predicted amidohydrolase YtcJ
MRLFENASFISCEDENRIHSILVEDGGRIVYLGDETPEMCRNAERFDLQGACVVPAFADTHIHFESFCLFHSTLDTRDARNFDELASMIRNHIETRPGEKVVLGFGSSAHTLEERCLPSLKDLDSMTSHPVLIVKYDGHAAVGNSAWIRGLPATVLNAGGFEKETGWFYRESFYSVIGHLTKSVPLSRVLKSMIRGSDYMARRGIGLMHTVEGVGFPSDRDVDLMRAASWGLPQTFRIYFQTMDTSKVTRRKMPRIGGCFATALDGCFGSRDAALKKPYSDNPSGTGTLFYSQETVNRFVKQANRAGLQVAMHAVGDAAVEQALNAYDAALSDFPREDHRHIIIHADLIDDSMIDRAASLGICVAVQTPFLYWNLEPAAYLESILGDRLRNFIPLKSLVDAGILLGNGSDAPCTYPDPIRAIHNACNHPNPDESISCLDALRTVTNWAAKLSFDEGETGTLTVGKRADFAALDQHLLDIPVGKIKDTSVRQLFLAGKPYSTPKEGALNLLGRCVKNRVLSGCRVRAQTSGGKD